MLLDILRHDVGYALRGLRRSPGLTATILATFALGIGVNAAMFTVVDRVFFQSPAGVADPASVRRLANFGAMPGQGQFANDKFSTREFAAFRAAAEASAEIEGYDAVSDRTIGDDPKRRTVAYATTGFLHVAGVRASRGRFFTADENRFGDPRRVAVLSHDYWAHALAADSAVLGRTIRIDTTLFTVVGIIQPRFDGMDLDVVDVWVPLATLPAGLEGSALNGDFEILQLFARLAPGTDSRSLEARLNTQFRRGRSFVLQRDSTIRLELAPLLQARSALRLGMQNERNLALLSRLAAVGVVVLIVAVTNVASLLLMRALRRRREIAIRIALGVSRARLAGQLVVESVILALLGGAVAVLIAFWAGGLLRTLLLSSVHWSVTVIDRRLVGLTMLVAVVAGAVVGLAPATVALGRNVMGALKAGAADAGRSKSWGRTALLATQTALCMLMLAAAGVFVQSLRNAANLDLGFDADRLITFNLFRIDENVGNAALDQIRALPEVVAVSRTGMDLRGGGTFVGLRLPNGDSIPVMSSPTGGFVGTDFVATAGLRILSGRAFAPSDVNGSEPVVIINQAMAAQYWPQRNAVGECIGVGRMREPCRRIVGVVASTRWDMTALPQRAFYIPMTQAPLPRCCSLVVVRTRARATGAVAAAINRIVADLPGRNRDYPPIPRLVSDRLAPQFRPWRIAAAMFLAFGVLALAAAAAGIYGLVGYDVTQRTHEFGVRITLGASSTSIVRLVVASGLRVVGIGVIAGALIAIASGRVIASLLFETSPYDPRVLVTTAATLSAVALLASLVPAWRATRVDPVVALRTE